MLRNSIQLLILPLLFALFGTGGKTTLCEVLSLAGVEVHHHAFPNDGGATHADPVCAETHEGHDHKHEEAPCPDSCEIRLSEGPAPVPAKLPMFCGVAIATPSFECSMAAGSSSPFVVSTGTPDPPEGGPLLHVPSITGRFLI